jgi:hypothetical protein
MSEIRMITWQCGSVAVWLAVWLGGSGGAIICIFV